MQTSVTDSGPPPVAPAEGRGARRTRFWAVMGLVLLAATVLRVSYVLTVTRHDNHVYDATYYELQARSIVDGEGFFQNPFARFDDVEPTDAADHPPLTALVLVPAAVIGDPEASNLVMRFTMVLIGLASVVLIGLLGRAVGGDTAGLIAATLAALDPNLWMNDGLLMSEALSVLLTVAILLAAYRVLERATLRRAVALGALCGLVVLARAELALLTVCVALPAVWLGSGDARARVTRLAACAGIGLLVVAPWVGYNLARFEEPTLISTNDGFALLAANCPAAYEGRNLGYTDIWCVPPNAPDQSVSNVANRSEALEFIGDNLDRLPVVAAARVGRLWSLYRIDQTAYFTEGEGRPTWATYSGTIALYLLVPLGVIGGIALRRRRVPIWPLVVPIVIVTVTVAVWTGGIPRYRAPAEPSIIVLASVGIVALLERLRSRRASRVESND